MRGVRAGLFFEAGSCTSIPTAVTITTVPDARQSVGLVTLAYRRRISRLSVGGRSSAICIATSLALAEFARTASPSSGTTGSRREESGSTPNFARKLPIGRNAMDGTSRLPLTWRVSKFPSSFAAVFLIIRCTHKGRSRPSAVWIPRSNRSIRTATENGVRSMVKKPRQHAGGSLITRSRGLDNGWEKEPAVRMATYGDLR